VSRFYGTLQGNRGEATRCGSTGSGICTYAAGWQGAVRTFVGAEGDVDWATVSLTDWHGCGSNIQLYSGPVGGPGYGDDNPKLGEDVNNRLWAELAGLDAKVIEIYKTLIDTLQPYQLRQLQEKLSRVGIEV